MDRPARERAWPRLSRALPEQSPIWQNLDAVKNNRVHKISYYDLFFDDPIAIEHQIELLTDMILGQSAGQ